jgi:hypothetical protein
MLYRVLGVVAMVIGVLFALVALLIFLPFLSNYNTSLLVLTLIFTIFAWVFGSIGWQLLHPPKPRGGHTANDGDSAIEGMGPGPEVASLRAASARVEASAAPTLAASIEPAYAKMTPAPDAGVVSVAPSAGVGRSESPPAGGAAQPVEESPTTVLDSFVGFGDDGSDAGTETRRDNGPPGNGHPAAAARPQFRKPGAPLPPDRALG